MNQSGEEQVIVAKINFNAEYLKFHLCSVISGGVSAMYGGLRSRRSTLLSLYMWLSGIYKQIYDLSKLKYLLTISFIVDMQILLESNSRR